MELPAHHVIEEIDFRANRAAGVAAVGIHSHDNATDRDRISCISSTSPGDAPFLDRTYRIGLADIDGSSGVGASIRFDFETVTTFPDGRVAVSFYDSTTKSRSLTGSERITPAIAIELETTLRRERGWRPRTGPSPGLSMNPRGSPWLYR